MVRRDSRGRETYYGKFRVGRQQVKKALGSNLTERQAKRALAKLVSTYRPRQQVDADRRKSVPEAAEAMISALEDDGTKPSTAYGYRAVAKRFSFFGALTVDRIGRREVERFAQDLLDGGLSPSTRWQTLRLLDAALKFAARRGWAIDPPHVEKPRGRRTQGPVRYLQQRDIERVLDAYPDNALGRVLRTLTLTAAWTGLRRGELLGLRWGNLDWDAQKVHVDESYVLGTWDVPKSGRGRSVPLPSRVARELRALRLATPYPGDGDPVFTHPDGTGKPLDASYVSKAFTKALKAAGAPTRRFHDLRHSYAVHAAKAGIPLTDLREWLGHADLATTSIYARYCPREGEAERVERAMSA
jgi:integrase